MQLSELELADVVADCGGKPITAGGERGWHFGMHPSRPEDTDAVTVPFRADEPVVVTAPRVLLTDYPKFLNGGRHPAYAWQRTGSCVDAGANNGLYIRSAIDALAGAAPGVWVKPWTLSAYGLSRAMYFGRDAAGEGSSGDAMCRALRELGSTEFDTPELPIPKPSVYDMAASYTAQQELFYSRFANTPEAVRAACKAHTIEYVRVTTADQAEAEVRKLRPLTWAGNWGSVMAMPYKGSGANRILYGPQSERWEHQQCVVGVWHHPEFGRLWNVLQNWYMLRNGSAVPVHGMPANDEAPGSYWVDDSAMNWQLNYRFGEVRSIASLKPYDQGKLSYLGV